jgi:hypothetical protein
MDIEFQTILHNKARNDAQIQLYEAMTVFILAYFFLFLANLQSTLQIEQ